MAMAHLNKVLIIEDNPEIVEAVSLALQIRWPGITIVTSSKGAPTSELIDKETPNLVILDLYLPDISGYDVLKQLRVFSDIPVVILTVRSEESDIVKGLELGADDYMIKPFRQLELLARIQAVLRRHMLDDENEIIKCGSSILNTGERILTFKDISYYLSGSETHILRRLMNNAGHVVSRRILSEELWGDDYPEFYVNLKTHIRRLREKIEQDPSQPKLIITRKGVGYYWGF